MTFFRENKKALLLIAMGIISIAFGAYRGEIMTVLHKAVIVCLECIGIG
jgi:hypothetical protein